MIYELFYWSEIQGRGEFVRLALEEAGARYRDVNRERGDGAAVHLMDGAETPSFAPPFLRDGDVLVGQMPAILLHLGPKLGLVPDDDRSKLWTHQIQLTLCDLVDEAHDVHHPIGTASYYEEQRPEAARRAEQFRHMRIPKFLAWFETILARNPHGPEHLVGDRLTYADLSLFQATEGLAYAFPQRMGNLLPRYPKIGALHGMVAARPNVAAYLESERRLPFSESGVFRHYPELDAVD